ncbi:hypothetical protein AG1IA_04558 [Rhizoctonia solani AG-1 IA]|uniref:Trafficking protein particle complex subunit 2-like protein n=1 Tax=Thanatephorus cucumeris (strain AG1-IA) TaxID=983506 RepID=L8WXB7_THACA|nr:hypothetical protein AG1IA_04558 [Rhizoctonia solani AG-1 IA]
MSRMRVNAVAFVYNQAPVLVRTYTASKDAELKYHYVAHTSLDVIDERGKWPLGVHVLVPDIENPRRPSRGHQRWRLLSRPTAYYGGPCCIWRVLRYRGTLHTAYAAALSNPFYRLSAQSDLKAPTIENQAGKNNLGKRVDEIVRVIGTIPVAADEQV